MNPSARLRGLYAITPDGIDQDEALLAQCRQVIAGGATLLQYRDKARTAAVRRLRGLALAALCARHEVPLIINDDLELACLIEGAGLHLGRADPDPRLARERLGPGRLIGVSCYDDLERGVQAAEAGADYLAFGSFFPSATKPGAARPRIELLREARARLDLPLVAIGGITPDNGRALIAAGADMLAVISGLFAAPEPKAAAERFASLFTPQQPEASEP